MQVSHSHSMRFASNIIYIIYMFIYIIFTDFLHYSSSYHQEIFLGDDQVFNLTDSTECDECIGLRPYNTPKEDKVLNNSNGINANRVRRNDLLPLSPYDGNLDIYSNYTGFIEIVGER